MPPVASVILLFAQFVSWVRSISSPETVLGAVITFRRVPAPPSSRQDVTMRFVASAAGARDRPSRAAIPAASGWMRQPDAGVAQGLVIGRSPYAAELAREARVARRCFNRGNGKSGEKRHERGCRCLVKRQSGAL